MKIEIDFVYAIPTQMSLQTGMVRRACRQLSPSAIGTRLLSSRQKHRNTGQLEAGVIVTRQCSGIALLTLPAL